MYSAHTSEKGKSKLWLVFVAVLLLALATTGILLYKRYIGSPIVASEANYPKYLSFVGDYAFSIPKGYVLDDQSVPGLQLLYTGKISVKDLNDAYDAGAIAVQPVTNYGKDAEAFKKKINETFVPEFKKISPDVTADFSSEHGSSVARITVTKDGKPARFVFIRSGAHGVQIVAKQESDIVKSVERTLQDVEASELKADTKPLQQTVNSTVQLIKEKKSGDLYKQLASEFTDKNTEADLDEALEKAAPYTQLGVLVSGAAYKINPNEFTVVLTMPPVDKDSKPTSGVLYLVKSSGQWKVKGLNLPSPAATNPDR